MARLYVARDDKSIVVSRSRVRQPGARPVRHPWSALVEVAAPSTRDHDRLPLVAVVVPPVATALITTASLSIEAGVVAGAMVFFGTSYLSPLLLRRRRAPKTRAARTVTLTAPADRAAFDRALGVADRISESWPRLGSLIDPPEAEALLAGALEEIAAVLARRQELTVVLAELSRPDFAAHSPGNETVRELRDHQRATKAALADLDIELARREASLSRAERAGHDFICEQEMREAIRTAEESLRTAHRPELGALPTPAPDAGADLAEHTRSVIDAYRELTTGLHRPSS